MKNYICFLLLFFSATLFAQTGTITTQVRINLEDLVIKDSAGTVFPTEIAKKLMQTGRYGLHISSDKTTGVLYMFSANEIERRESMTPKPKESNFFRTGDKIASFNERDIHGNKFNLKELTAGGKVVVLNFWFINCPPCRAEMPQLNELVEKYKNNPDVVFIAVSLDQKYEIEDFLKTNPYNYHIIDNGRFIAEKYNINLYPTHVVLDKQGKVLFHTSGLGSGTVPWIKKSIETGLTGILL